VSADPTFAELPLREIRGAALDKVTALGCSHGEVRVERIRSQVVVLRNGRVETTVDDTEVGMGVRVVREKSMGFAGTVELHTDAASEMAVRAVEMAQATAPALAVPVDLAPEPGYGEVVWSSAYEIDPTTVTVAEKVALLEEWSERLLAHPSVDLVTAYVLAVVEDKHFADLSGTVVTQRRVRMHPVVEVFAVDGAGGSFESMRTLAPPAGRGWEYVAAAAGGGSGSGGWDWDTEIGRLGDLLAEKMAAPSVGAGTYDLVIDPSNLWLTIHESVGHATELDRALGYEAAYAGTSFATFDKLGTLRYGSKAMNVTGDRTTPHGLASVGYDDEGVEAQSFDIVKEGVLVGYQLDRRMAVENDLGRSNGCAFADSPLHAPIQRMANVSLAPASGVGPTTEELIAGVENGVYVVGDKSWSIDMQRYNFQFTGQRFYRIDHGRLAGQLRDVAYQATTTDFWGSLDAVGGTSTYVLGGAFNCGKGQPPQVAPVSHGCPSGLFRGINVLNARAETGR
jgi:TldD protein